MQAGPSLENRVAAANGLQLLADPLGGRAMLAEWQRVRKSLPEKLDACTEPYLPNSPFHLLSFLAASEAPEAILALGRDSGPLPTEWAEWVINALEGRVSDWKAGTWATNPGTMLTIEDFLASFLDDRTPCATNVRSTVQNRLINRPRLCDHAAEALRALWPKRYHFDGCVTPEARDRQCVEAGNVWLRKLGETPERLAAKSEKSSSAPELSDQITAIEWEPGSREPAGKWGLKVEALKGKTLESLRVSALLSSFAAKPPEGATGMVIEIFRYSDRRGVTLWAALQTEHPAAAERGAPWKVHVMEAGRDGKEFRTIWDTSARTWKWLDGFIAAEGANPAGNPFVIRAELRRTSAEANGGPRF